MSALQVRLSAVCLFLTMILMGEAAQAQYAPTPKSAPRTPVRRELISGKEAPGLPASRVLEGKATFMDAERLKIGDFEMRLFGVVPPQMGASYGPQARALVDALAQGDISCRIHDRARDGQYMAVCKNGNGVDFGLELLRRGLAATARGTLQSSDLGPAYLAAEQAAQLQRMGIWSATLPSALSDKLIKEAAAKVEAAKAEAVAKAEAEAEAKIKEAAAKAEAAQKAIELADKATISDIAIPAGLLVDPAAEAKVPPAKPETKPLEIGPTAADVQAVLSAPAPAATAELAAAAESKGFFERYQLLTTGLLGLLAALSITGGVLYRHARDRREDLRALAAALRGELMAARSICLARLAKMTHEPDEKNVTWPRLRTLVFQAYVGRLGHLGADLARQISSIYGQASDYAAYYVGAESRPDLASKKQALQTLVHHIEEVMPRLTQVEREGWAPRAGREALPPSVLSRVLRPVTATIERHLPSSSGPQGGQPLPPPQVTQQPAEEPARAAILDELPDVKSEMMGEHRSAETRASHRAFADARALAEAKAEEKKQTSEPETPARDEADDTVVLKKDILQNVEPEIARAVAPETTSEEAQAPAEHPAPILQEPAEEIVAAHTEAPKAEEEESEDSKKNSIHFPEIGKTKVQGVKPAVIAGEKAVTKKFSATAKAAKPALGPVSQPAAGTDGINFAAPIFEKLSRIKSMATAQLDRLKPQPIEDLLPDYANLTEEELEALSYAEAYLAACTPKNERKAG